MSEDARGKVADLHLLAVQQRPHVVQEALHHQLPVQLPDLCYVVLQISGQEIMSSLPCKFIQDCVCFLAAMKALNSPAAREPSAE